MPRADLIDSLAASGWVTCPSIADGLCARNLPLPTNNYLADAFPGSIWRDAEQVITSLTTHFAPARFAETAEFGILLVPDPAKLDVRGALDPAIRHDQIGISGPDVIASQLPEGKLGILPGHDWTLVATITGIKGLHQGSDDSIRDAPTDAFIVNEVDTRTLMTRQIWGARVLQRGTDLPDCEFKHSCLGPSPCFPVRTVSTIEQ